MNGARVAVGVLTLLALAGTGASPALGQAADIGVAVNDPRAYGYVVGDRVTRGVRLTLPDGYRLERASLPSAGRLDYWLDLVDISISERDGRGDVALTYQLFYAPLQAVRRVLPAFTVRAVDDDGNAVDARVPGFALTVSPIIELQPEAKFGDADNDLMLPDERPSTRDIATPRRRALIAAAVAGLGLLVWAWIADRLPGRRRGAFARAARHLKGLRRGGTPDTASALRIVHRAFDAAAGRAVFTEDVDAFVDARPAFADLRDDIVAFFEFSRRFFFADAAAGRGCAGDLDALVYLAERCRRREARG